MSWSSLKELMAGKRNSYCVEIYGNRLAIARGVHGCIFHMVVCWLILEVCC